MTRDDGFAVADTDTGMMSDPKVLSLARRMRDSVRTAAALALYDAVRLASWRAGSRLTLEDTAPAWWLDPLDDYAAALVAVGLLDTEHRIPDHAWEGWFGPARDRRQEYRELGRRGGRATAAKFRATNEPDGQPDAKAHAEPDAEPHAQARSEPSRPDRTDNAPSLRSGVPRAGDPATNGEVINGEDWERVIAELGTIRGRPGAPRSRSPLTATLRELVADFGADAVVATMREVGAGLHKPSLAQVIYGTDRKLHPLPDSKPEPRGYQPDPKAVRDAFRH